MQSPLYHLQNISFAYQGSPALAELSLTIERGERLALLGANGSGKSTLIRILAALSFPQSGSLTFDGQPLTAEAMEEEQFFFSFRRRVGIVFQNPDTQLFNASVFDEVAFAPLHLRLPEAEVRRRVEATMAHLSISHLRDRTPHRLSGGEKKRVALASVLVMDPEVLLLDEPAAALDPARESDMLHLLSSWKNTGRTVVMATHDLSSLEDIADRCCVLQNGRLLHTGPPLQILHDVPLLERAGLVRRHSHSHPTPPDASHPHIHS